MSEAFDLSKARAARDEVLRTPKMLVIDGDSYELPPSIPVDVPDALVEGRLGEATSLLFGVQAGEFKAKHQPDISDLMDIINGVYGTSLGNLLPSGATYATPGSS